jgi:hypothetical protein
VISRRGGHQVREGGSAAFCGGAGRRRRPWLPGTGGLSGGVRNPARDRGSGVGRLGGRHETKKSPLSSGLSGQGAETSLPNQASSQQHALQQWRVEYRRRYERA